MTSKASLHGAEHERNIVEKKPVSSVAVSLGKALNGMPSYYVADRLQGRKVILVAVVEPN